MFKLAISLIALAVFQCACASPIPPSRADVLADKVAELSGSLSGLTPRQIGDLISTVAQDGSLEDVEGLVASRQADLGELEAIPSLLDEIDTLGKRQGLPIVGGILEGLPVVGSLAGGAAGGSLVPGLRKRQGLPIVGGILEGLPVVGSLAGGAAGGSLVPGLRKRQSNLPIVGGGTPALGPIIDDAAGGSLASGLLKRQSGLPTPAEIPVVGPIVFGAIGPILPAEGSSMVGPVAGGAASGPLKRQSDLLDLVPGLGGLEGDI